MHDRVLLFGIEGHLEVLEFSIMGMNPSCERDC